MGSTEYSIVEYFGSGDGHECGYCHSIENGRVSHGLWAHRMTVETYQDLLDRGWRRSGHYCYKPIMKKTCCPQYTIKCDVMKNAITRGQKKTLKSFYNYIQNDVNPKVKSNPVESKDKGDSKNSDVCVRPKKPDFDSNLASNGSKNTEPDKSSKKRFQRYQRKVAKLKERGLSDEEIATHFETKKSLKLLKNKPKKIEEYFTFHSDGKTPPKHKFEVKLVPSAGDDEAFIRSKTEEHAVYTSYQVAIHGDSPKDVKMKQFTRFLIDSPLQYQPLRPSSAYKAGSFHQQYWLDDELIAVGVIDILNTCLSSVYLFYEPKYSFLSLGRVSALYEIAFTQTINSAHPDFRYYYMGFYIHSCPKMKYKGDYKGSSLLCPETYFWYPLKKVTPKLDETKYCRFAPEAKGLAKIPSVSQLLVLYERTAMPYSIYLNKNPSQKSTEEKEVSEFCELVGPKAIQNMLLFRSGAK